MAKEGKLESGVTSSATKFKLVALFYDWVQKVHLVDTGVGDLLHFSICAHVATANVDSAQRVVAGLVCSAI